MGGRGRKSGGAVLVAGCLVACSSVACSSVASAQEGAAPDVALYDDPVAFQLRLGYEVTSQRLDRLSFAGRAGLRDEWLDTVRYDRDGIADRVVLHGVSIQPNLVYQPSEAPLQLLVGIRVGFGLGAPPSYETETDTVVAVPDPDQPVVGLRTGVPFGLRIPLGPVGLRGEMIPGVAMIAIDERVQALGGYLDGGTSIAGAFSMRGQGGLDLRLGDLVGVYVDAGYDMGALRGWSLGLGLALLGEPGP